MIKRRLRFKIAIFMRKTTQVSEREFESDKCICKAWKPSKQLSRLLCSFISAKADKNSVIPFLFIRPSSDGTYYGMVMSVRVSIRVSVRPSVRPTLRPSGLRPPIFRTFLLHALTYWAEILHMTLFWCTTDQVRLSSLCVNFWRSYASFVNLE